MTERAIIFTHIPKCKGSSIRESVKAMLGDDLLAAYDARKRELIKTKPLLAMQGKRGLFGHFAFPINPIFIDKSDYFTVLRDPVRRAARSGSSCRLDR